MAKEKHRKKLENIKEILKWLDFKVKIHNDSDFLLSFIIFVEFIKIAI